jgi:hypothetical protein
MLASIGWGGANCNDSKKFDLLHLYLFHGWQENVFLFFSFWLSTQGVKQFLFSLTHNYKRTVFLYCIKEIANKEKLYVA